MKLIVLSLLVGLLCAGCEKQSSSEKENYKHYKVKQEVFKKTLYFSGTIGPIKKYAVIIPFASSVGAVFAHYGQKVNQGEKLIQLNSIELQKKFNDTLTSFLKSKNDYALAKSKFVGTQELWNFGLISKNNFLSEKSSLENSRVSLLEARLNLNELFAKIPDIKSDEVSGLSLSKPDKIKEILNRNYHIIDLRAPADGIVLYPPKFSEEKSEGITVGSQLKSGQIFSVIGDLSGVALKINISEVDIEKIKKRLPARVKGLALSNQTMKGYVASVNAQASRESGAGGGFPVFNAIVEVPELTPAQQKRVKVGMSATVEIDVEAKKVIMVPMAAIYRQGQENRVKLEIQGKILERAVTTGGTTVDKVVIISGLKAGDEVVYR